MAGDENVDDDYEFLIANEQFEQKRRYERIPKSSAQLISRLISRSGFTQTRWHEQIASAWRSVAGDSLAEKTQPTIVRRGVLEVIVNSSPAMQQLAFVKTELLDKMQQLLPEANIKSIRFRVGRIR